MKFFATISAAVAACAMTVSAEVATDTVWGYRTNDPSMVHTSKWAEHWPACGGKRQSPIDIVTTAKAGKGRPTLPLSFTGNCPQWNLTEPHEPLDVVVSGGNCKVVVNEASYDAAQFHVHAPSEHTLNGKALDGEIHFVHQSSDGKSLLVVGIFLDIGPKSDPWLGPLLDALETVNSTNHSEAILVQLKSYSALVRKASGTGGIYNYPGSLTTPACDENADWWVVSNPIKISSNDFGRLHRDLVEYHITDDGNNARPVQPLNGRQVVRYH
ncbi:Carbonic anhydrase [Phytophthora palmivora]|uniref:carbonic anhydrase n=1 Tax=Phytophthora palmivora TaxID=4796 RepID=A0A2P4X9L0_9STRA|nr:Carbonic anhydrase [Phytophthora palmivora]